MNTLRFLIGTWASLMMGWAHAQSASTEAAPFKLTLGHYAYPGDQGHDINLRYTHQDSHVWVGQYRDNTVGQQSRIGGDTSMNLNEFVSLQPSLQAATGGFVGGSLNAQIGHETFALLGWGRTNLKPYFNLNFDPNDAITLGGGHTWANGQTWSVFVVRDDRLHTGQTDWHLTGRIPVEQDRLSIDIMRKTGMGDSGDVRAWAYSLTWDFPRWLIRLARDPKQNFSSNDAWRVAAGVRF